MHIAPEEVPGDSVFWTFGWPQGSSSRLSGLASLWPRQARGSLPTSRVDRSLRIIHSQRGDLPHESPRGIGSLSGSVEEVVVQRLARRELSAPVDEGKPRRKTPLGKARALVPLA